MDGRAGLDARAHGRHVSTHVLARLATTGIYLVRDVPRDLQRAARARAVRESTTLRWVLRPLKTSQPRVRERKRPLRPASGDSPGFLTP